MLLRFHCVFSAAAFCWAFPFATYAFLHGTDMELCMPNTQSISMLGLCAKKAGAPVKVAEERGKDDGLEYAQDHHDHGAVVGGEEEAVQGVRQEQAKLLQLHQRDEFLDRPGHLGARRGSQVVTVPAGSGRARLDRMDIDSQHPHLCFQKKGGK